MPATASETIVFRPGPRERTQSNVARFMRTHSIADPQELITRSQQDPEWFWDAVVSELGIEFFTPYTKVMDAADPPFSRWFLGGTVNLAYNCVDRHALGPRAGHVAITWEGEDAGSRQLTYVELRRDVAQLAAALTELGIGRGDVVGVFMPMVPEVCVGLYACASIGAIAVPIFSGFGAEAVGSRLAHSGARALLCADGTYRRGKIVSMKETVDAALKLAPSVTSVVVFRRIGSDARMQSGRDHWWHEVVANRPTDMTPASLDPEHPFMLAYTSGTTGAPKAAVHVHGGFLVKIAEEVHFQVDMNHDDVLYWVTDMGWIMGPWEVIGAHALGGTVALCEGAPDWPTHTRLWEFVERQRVSILGVSPTLIRAIAAKTTDADLARSDMSTLRILASSGEPWNPDPYMWLFEKVGHGRCPIINLSGGTEVGACFLSPMPLTPLKPTTLGWPSLGMAMEVRDTDGAPLGPGEGVGELVCTRPWPGMTRGFWGPGGRKRYLEAYWSRWPGVWVHGDWASIDADGLWYLHGRSDDTMNVAGKRIGPAEYESILVDHPAVVEAAAVGIPHAVKGETVWCFAVLASGRRASEGLRIELTDLVGERLGKAFRPGEIRFVKALPKTRSAKIVRRAIRAAAMGEEIGDTSSIENPESLRAITQHA